jgi:ribosomal protein S7
MLDKKLSYENKTLYKKFLGFLIKKGNKVVAKKILDETFLIVSKTTGFSMDTSMLKLFLNLNSFVEVKKVRVGRRSLLIPFSINLKRRSYLIVKWLMQAIKEDKKKSSLSMKLSEEILSVLVNSSSKSKKLRNVNIAQAVANRSNIHYRW